MSLAAPQLFWLITHLTLWWRWSPLMDTMWWNCLDSDWELCRRPPFCVKTLQDRLTVECVTGKPSLSVCLSGDSLLASVSALLKSEAGRRWFGASETQTSSVGFCGFSCGLLVGSACEESWGLSATRMSASGFCSLFCAVWVCCRLSETSKSLVQVMTGAALAGLMGRWQSVAVGNQGLKTGRVRQGKDSRSFSVLSSRQLSPASDPSW